MTRKETTEVPTKEQLERYIASHFPTDPGRHSAGLFTPLLQGMTQPTLPEDATLIQRISSEDRAFIWGCTMFAVPGERSAEDFNHIRKQIETKIMGPTSPFNKELPPIEQRRDIIYGITKRYIEKWDMYANLPFNEETGEWAPQIKRNELYNTH